MKDFKFTIKVVHYGDMYGISQHPNLASKSQHSLFSLGQ